MKEKRNKNKWIIIAAIIVGIALAVIGLNLKNEEKKIISKTKSVYELEYNLSITQFDNYTGEFIEDGSDQKIEDVMMIVLKNNGENTLQYAELTLEYESYSAEFAFSTLLPNEEMLVLEKNCQKYHEEEIISATLKNVVFFAEEPSLHEELFSITTMEGALNLENISESVINAPIAIYYKNKSDGMYYGGITYRTVIENTMEAGEIVQIMTKHFSLDNSEIMFITYAD